MGKNISHFRLFIALLSLDDICYCWWTALAIRSWWSKGIIKKIKEGKKERNCVFSSNAYSAFLTDEIIDLFLLSAVIFFFYHSQFVNKTVSLFLLDYETKACNTQAITMFLGFRRKLVCILRVVFKLGKTLKKGRRNNICPAKLYLKHGFGCHLSVWYHSFRLAVKLRPFALSLTMIQNFSTSAVAHMVTRV